MGIPRVTGLAPLPFTAISTGAELTKPITVGSYMSVEEPLLKTTKAAAELSVTPWITDVYDIANSSHLPAFLLHCEPFGISLVDVVDASLVVALPTLHTSCLRLVVNVFGEVSSA